ncbi:DUF6585 family protein [Nocardia sp. NPDC048505]|uniref:DUF6585 family protein n=1 Tax=unclassified Nocardia TaxID=2637762 RepID=UPI0033CB933D
MSAEFTAADAESAVAARVRAAAEQAGLGRSLASYSVPMPNWRRVIVWGIVVALMLAGIGYAALSGAEGVVWVVGGFFVLPIAGPFLVGLGSALRIRRKYRDARLELFEHGLVRAQQGQVRVVRYDTTQLFQRGGMSRRSGKAESTVRYDLLDVAGERVELSHDYSFQQQWASTIQQAILNIHYPRALAELQAGGRLGFGELWISASEVGDRKTAAPWSRVNSIDLAFGEILAIGVEGRVRDLVNISLSKIPNYVVFRALAEHLRASAASR